jgi:hypothetical protein
MKYNCVPCVLSAIVLMLQKEKNLVF